jgi:hypothetical protein
MAHYSVHLWQAVSRFADLFYITVANQPVDGLVAEHIPRVHFLLDPSRDSSIAECRVFL